MKTQNLISMIGLISLTAFCPQLTAAPMGTAFTYQGKLMSGMNAANGLYDFSFAAFDAASGGVQQGATLTKNAVSVSNGLFLVALDFGSIFNGEARWLSISVKTNGAVSYVLLDPRQPLTPSPYALYTPNAGSAALLNGQSPANFAPASGSTVYVAKTGDTMTGALWVNYADGLRVGANQLAMSGGNVGIGTTTPQAKLEVNGVVQVDSDLKAARLNVGSGHTLGGLYTTIAGGLGNQAASDYATVGGGGYNHALGISATVAGGYNNQAVRDAAIGGGAENTASSQYTTVAGGTLNTASNQYATVGGGAMNRAFGMSTTIAGGYDNQASNSDATVGGGLGNAADGFRSTVGGGEINWASASHSTIGGGYQNLATNSSTSIAGGYQNLAGANAATVAGGANNSALGNYSAVAGGGANRASGPNSFVAGGDHNTAEAIFSSAAGSYAKARVHGQQAIASGAFNTAAGGGDAQGSLYVLRNVTTGTGLTELFLDGSGSRITVPSGSAWTFEILVVARSQDFEFGTAGVGAFRMWGVIYRGGAGTFMPFAAGEALYRHDPAWNAYAVLDDVNHALAVKVVGSGTLRWVATVRTAEVMFP